MSQRNSENDGLVLVGVAFVFMFILLYAVACFVAIVLTMVALCALDKPVTIYKWTTTPREARIFLGCGVAGLVGLPVFVIFCAALFKFQIQPDWWGYILLGGYSLGALGLGSALLDADQKEQAAKFVTLQQSPPPALPSPEEAKPSVAFRFASWFDDDEDAR